MGNWFELSLGAPAEPIAKVAEGIAEVTGIIATIIDIHKTALQIVSTLTTDLLNAEALLMKTALSVLEDVLGQYIDTDAKVHVLLVPIRKRPPWNLQSDFKVPSFEDSWNIDETIPEEKRKRFYEVISRIGEYNQGNEGFLRTVYEETLDDDGDSNRPQYDSDAAYAAMVMVAGAQDVIGVMDLASLLQGIMGTALKGNSLIPDTISRTPQNLRATVSAVDNSPRVAILLEWENPPVLQTFSDFEGLRVRLDEIAIVRSENDQTPLAATWSDIFGSSQPSALGEDDGPQTDVLESADKKSKVIYQARFEGVLQAYADTDSALEKEKDYYYTVAYRYSYAAEPGSDGKVSWVTMDYVRISNVAKARFRKTTPARTGGTKPNWYTHPSPLDLIPGLKFLMLNIKTQIEALKSNTTGAASALQSYIDFLDAEATRYADYADAINAQTAKLASMLQIPSAGVYMTSMASSNGGTYGFLEELTDRMSDKTDTTAPPFHRNGFVTGIVMMAGAPNPAELTSFNTLMGLLFGGGGAKTAFEKALDSIDRLLDDVEEKLFGDDMQPTTEAPTESVVYKTFDDAMNPVAADSTDANISFDP